MVGCSFRPFGICGGVSRPARAASFCREIGTGADRPIGRCSFADALTCAFREGAVVATASGSIDGILEAMELVKELSVTGLTSNPTIFVKSLAAPHSVNTMPEKTLRALADHGEVGPMLPHDGGDAEEVLDRFRGAGVDLDALAADLQREGAAAFVKSWQDLLVCIEAKSATLRKAG